MMMTAVLLCVYAGVSPRKAAKSIEVFNHMLHGLLGVNPCHTTIRTWLAKMGLDAIKEGGGKSRRGLCHHHGREHLRWRPADASRPQSPGRPRWQGSYALRRGGGRHGRLRELAGEKGAGVLPGDRRGART